MEPEYVPTGPGGDPFESIREEILRKKAERQSVDSSQMEEEALADSEEGSALSEPVMQSEVSTQKPIEAPASPSLEPAQSSYQEFYQAQEKEILKKQKEADALLKQVQHQGTNTPKMKRVMQSSDRISAQIRKNFNTRKRAQVALITGEILSRPLAMRAGDSNF